MAAGSRFDAPATLARALAEMARRSGSERSREAELRAVLPSVLGPWLHARVTDVRLTEAECVVEMAGEAPARGFEAVRADVRRELERRLSFPLPRLRAAAGPAPPRPVEGPEGDDPADRPLTMEAAGAIPDPDLRRRLLRWAGVRARG